MDRLQGENAYGERCFQGWKVLSYGMDDRGGAAHPNRWLEFGRGL